jgi:acetylornithine deacetylase/succinyl-diaminopimelate desuccinylase-like protein
MTLRAALILSVFSAGTAGVASAAQAVPSLIDTATEIFRELIAINTAEPDGNTTIAAERIAARLRDAGFAPEDVKVLGPDERHGSLVARLRGSGRGRPVLLLAHLDVVPASRADWTYDPFVLTEHDGYYYGRGTTDDKQFAAIWAAAFIAARRALFVPDRDVILALTAGEEGGVGDTNGVTFLLTHHRNLVDAEYVINGDAGGGSIKDGRNVVFGVQAAEKRYMDVKLEVTNRGGHSSLPVKDNAIYRLARALGRVDDLTFPIRLDDVTRAYFVQMAGIEGGATGVAMRALAAGTAEQSAIGRLAADPLQNGMMRTTCVATMVSAGHAPNALPQRAQANVNCRLLPDEKPEAVIAVLTKAIADPAVSVSLVNKLKPALPAQSLHPGAMSVIKRAADAVWPGVPLVPLMEPGGTDGVFFRELGIPAFGVNHFGRDDDVRAHGRDERIGIREFEDAVRFGYAAVRVAGGAAPVE